MARGSGAWWIHKVNGPIDRPEWWAKHRYGGVYGLTVTGSVVDEGRPSGSYEARFLVPELREIAGLDADVESHSYDLEGLAGLFSSATGLPDWAWRQRLENVEERMIGKYLRRDRPRGWLVQLYGGSARYIIESPTDERTDS